MSRILLVLLLAFICLPVQASEDDSKVFSQILIGEGLFALNSWMASEAPNVYGGIGLVLFPLFGMSSDLNTTTNVVGVIGAESIAIYNLSVNEDDYSKSEVFKNNMIGWHLFIGAFFLTGYLTDDFSENESISFLPDVNGGGHLVYNIKF